MHLRLVCKLFPALLLALAVFPLYSQVQPAATQGGLPLVVGLGGADYAIDWGPGTRMEGITAWVDFYPWGLPPKIHGLGVEVEGRDLNFNRPVPKMRQDTGLGGVIYSFSHFKNVKPYVKFLAGIGSIDFPVTVGPANYTHDTFLITAPGGGADIRIWNHFWARADYEYQSWHHTFGPNDLNPNGVSFGVLYDFRPKQTER